MTRRGAHDPYSLSRLRHNPPIRASRAVPGAELRQWTRANAAAVTVRASREGNSSRVLEGKGKSRTRLRDEPAVLDSGVMRDKTRAATFAARPRAPLPSRARRARQGAFARQAPSVTDAEGSSPCQPRSSRRTAPRCPVRPTSHAPARSHKLTARCAPTVSTFDTLGLK